MNVQIASSDPSRLRADVLFVPMFEEDNQDRRPENHGLVNAERAFRNGLRKLATQEGFAAKPEQTFLVHTQGKLRAQRLVLIGLGSKKRFTTESLRMAAGRAAKIAAKVKATSTGLVLPNIGELAANIQAVTEGFVLGRYRFDAYRSSKKDDAQAATVTDLRLLTDADTRRRPELQDAVATGTAIAEATNWARDLVNEPASVMTPTRLANEAKSLAKLGLKVTIGGRPEIEALKMGMFLGVAQGSAEEPRLIHIVYQPKGRDASKEAPIALVGKAITFDSGGLSLKSADAMVDMKTDMAGSAAVLAAMRVIAAMKPSVPVHAFIGACENMPSGTAYRPGDILTSRLGKTVEITNTDAEGRLVLGDILTWATEHKPALLVDLATLTGACIVALGNYITGVFGEDDAAVQSVLTAAESAGELMWRLPIPDVQKDALRSEVADMKNSGERWGGAINAAVFLREFTGNTPWVHLDIAGPSQSPKDRGYYIKGATGVGVRTLVELVRRHAQPSASASTSNAPALAGGAAA